MAPAKKTAGRSLTTKNPKTVNSSTNTSNDKDPATTVDHDTASTSTTESAEKEFSSNTESIDKASTSTTKSTGKASTSTTIRQAKHQLLLLNWQKKQQTPAHVGFGIILKNMVQF